jgi:hypothetical protein
MTCEQARNLFLEAYYKDLDEQTQKEFEQHLAGCGDCSAAYLKFETTLSLMARRAPATPDESFSANLWDSLKSAIASEAVRTPRKVIPFTSRLSQMASMPPWAYGIAATLLIALGIYLGKTYFAPSPVSNVHTQEQRLASGPAIPDSLSPEATQKLVDDYLDRSRTLLLGFIHSSGAHSSPENFAAQQQRSRDLIEQASYVESKLNGPDRERFRQLIGDLTVILRELANYSNQSGVSLIEIVKQGVDTKSILLKINLEQMRAFGAQLPAGKPKNNVDPKSKI